MSQLLDNECLSQAEFDLEMENNIKSEHALRHQLYINKLNYVNAQVNYEKTKMIYEYYQDIVCDLKTLYLKRAIHPSYSGILVSELNEKYIKQYANPFLDEYLDKSHDLLIANLDVEKAEYRMKLELKIYKSVKKMLNENYKAHDDIMGRAHGCHIDLLSDC